jgi:hypothetical protein
MAGSFLIDPQGIILNRHVGLLNAETLRAKLAEVSLWAIPASQPVGVNAKHRIVR